MFASLKIQEKYKNQFKTKVNSDFDINAFFNVINKGLKIIKENIIDNNYLIDLNNVISFYFYNQELWLKIKKEIIKFRKERNLVINNKNDSLEAILENLYEQNMQLLKIKNFDSIMQIKNLFFYFVAGIFILISKFKKDSNAVWDLIKENETISLIKELDNLCLIYEKQQDDIILLLITLIDWCKNSLIDLLAININFDLKSPKLLFEAKQQIINHNDNNSNKNEQQAKIIPLKLTAEKLKKLNEYFKAKIIGQDQVIDKINEILISEMYNISKKTHRPIGVLFFVGPTGVGKTETVKELAKFLYDSEQIHRFDMSEYKSEVAIQKLIGAPNGYVGYQEGGTLTNAMIKNPNTLVLFDEIEKADKSVFDLFLQMIDEGVVTSNKGVKCYFDNTIIVFTSNLGVSNLTARMGKDKIEEIIKENVEYFFNHTINRPELLGRIGNDNIVVFNFIDKKEDLYKILDIQFNTFIQEYKALEINFKFNKELVYDAILANIDLTKGARDIRNKFELFKKHLYQAFFMKELSIDDMKNKTIEFNYNNKIVDIIKINQSK